MKRFTTAKPRDNSLIHAAPVLQPTIDVSTSGIVMSPVHDAAFRIPFVFTIEGDRVAHFEGWNPWGQVDVVRNEQGLARS